MPKFLQKFINKIKEGIHMITQGVYWNKKLINSTHLPLTEINHQYHNQWFGEICVRKKYFHGFQPIPKPALMLMT